MVDKRLRVLTNVLLVAAALVTTFYLLMLGWYNTLTLDDYGWSDIETRGLFNWVSNVYMTWEGRWSAFTIDACIWKLWAHANNLILFTVLHLALGYVSTYYLLKKLFAKKSFDGVLLIFSILAVNLSLLALQEISTLYWLCCPHYIMCVWAVMWLCNMLFLTDQYKWWHVLTIILMSIYISGLAETFTPLVIMVLGIVWLYNIFKQKRYNFVKEPKDLYLTISLVILVVGFLVMVLAPGNSARVETMSENSFVGNFALGAFCFKWCKATIILGLRFISKTLYYIALAVIAAWVGYGYKDNEKVKALALNIKQMVLLTLALVLFFAISVAPCVYAMGWYAPPRSFSYMSFVFAFYAVWLGLAYGTKVQRPAMTILAVNVVAICISVLAVMWTVREQPIVAEYNAWVKECRVDIQKKKEENDKTPYIAKKFVFPAELNTYSRMCKLMGKKRVEYQYPYMIFDLTTDPKHWKNSSLKHYMHADFDIIGWSEE